jgi:hypothetical protein
VKCWEYVDHPYFSLFSLMQDMYYLSKKQEKTHSKPKYYYRIAHYNEQYHKKEQG